MSSVCRVCLAGNGRLDSLENKLLIMVYEKLANTKFYSDDARPRALCSFCSRKLLKCHMFSNMAQRSEKIFNQLYGKGLEESHKYTETNQGLKPHLTAASLQNILHDESPQVPIEDESILVKEEVYTEQDQLMEVKEEYPPEWLNKQLILEQNSNIQRNNEEVSSKINVDQIKLDDSRKFHCNNCGKIFVLKSQLISHILKSHSKLKGKDDSCNVNDKQNTAILKTKDGKEKKLTCNYCRKEYNQKHDLDVHMKIHTEKPFTCSICDKKFRRKDTLVIHTRIHSEKKLYACDLCNKQFSVKEHWVRHIRNHAGVKPYACHKCKKTFTTKANLMCHKKTHVDTRVKAFDCKLCDKKYFRNISLVNHMKTHLGQKPFTCYECNMEFTCKSSLDRHKITHTGEKSFPCKECDKQFFLKYNLLSHMRIHTGEKPFSCHVCDKHFNQKQTLDIHMRSHTGEKPFPCHECEKRFSCRASLVAHKKSHTGERPFICNLCDKPFVNKSNLIKHLKTHSGQKGHCDKKDHTGVRLRP